MYGLTEVDHGIADQSRDITGTQSLAVLVAEALPASLLKSFEQDAPNRASCPVAPVETSDGDALEWRSYEHLALVAHELRSSLGTIRSAAWLMQMYRRTPDVAKEAQATLSRQVDQMSRLIEDLLEVSQVRVGRLRLQPERTDLRVVAKCAVDSVQAEIRQRNQGLQVDLPKTPVWLQADPGRLTQVLVNLLGNATKYTDEWGELRLSVEREAAGAAVRVSDTGIGIAPEVLPHIFEPFVQAESALPRCNRGIGIGLALVSCLVELHGGRVCAASAGLGMGSEFVVHLPVLPG
jgi:two-component system CheB/CheR fusion protein